MPYPADHPPPPLPPLHPSIAEALREHRFLRIYAPILAQRPGIASEHALRQEEKVHSESNNNTYTTFAASALMKLRKRPVAMNVDDVGIDGEWVERKVEPIPMEKLRQLLVPTENLKAMGYPFPPEVEEAPSGDGDVEMGDGDVGADDAGPAPKSTLNGSVNGGGTGKDGVVETKTKDKSNKEICDRCKSTFLVRTPMAEGDREACTYHWGWVRTDKNAGQKDRVYTCCGQVTGSAGCCSGPHVFKEEGYDTLNARIPFTEAPEDSTVPNALPIVALDCEMSYTTIGMELTRLTVLNWEGHVILDELVKPAAEILDLNTRWSGITPEALAGASLDLEGVRRELGRLVGRGTVIVGHGLENDLNALRMTHTNVIDTAFLFPHPKGLPFRYSLRVLTEKLLRRFIQQGGSAGHDSAEDARASLELVKGRCRGGEWFVGLCV
ncbi:RNA exonuclease 3 [Rhizophlyctis rosea]|nr:RNA exonuclease 3 [Rhizophlyctis rosea]